MHNLTNMRRTKSDSGLISDYPHYYELSREGAKEGAVLFAVRQSENGEFVLSQSQGVFCRYGPNDMGVLRPNMLGTHFELIGLGLPESKLSRDLPRDFFPQERILQVIEYDSNFFAERPRSFRTQLFDATGPAPNKSLGSFENLPPKFNANRNCYTLNFFGRVAKASARNF